MPDNTMVLPTLVGPEQGVATCQRQTLSQDRILLDGTWDFLHLPEDYRSDPVGWRSIQVPGPWQAQFAELRMRGGTGIYRRQVEIPAGWKRRRIFLEFGAVFHITRAWVNGELVGLHIGGFLPFSFDVTEQLVEGVNEIKVRVDSPMDDPNEYPEAPFAEIPFGKQSWYGPLSGIWQSVWLEPRAVDHITRARITPELATGRVGVRAFFAQPLVAETRAEVTVECPDSETVGTEPSLLESGSEQAELALILPDVRAWSPAAPNLYTLQLVLRRGGDVVDKFEDRFGFRTIETRGGH